MTNRSSHAKKSILIIQIFTRRKCCDGAVGGGGGQLSYLLLTAIPCGKDPRCRGLTAFICHNITVGVKLDHIGKRGILRKHAHGFKNTRNVKLMHRIGFDIL